MAINEVRCASGQLLCLPSELQLRIMEGLGGQDLCAVEASCRDLRRLITGNAYLYKRVIAEEFSSSIKPASSSTDWKALYVDTFIRARLETLEKHRLVCEALKLRVEELDNLLGDADDVREIFGAPELMASEPAFVLAMVGEMEQEVLQQRWDASEDLISAESKLLTVQTEVQSLLARVPRYWWPAALQAAAGGFRIA